MKTPPITTLAGVAGRRDTKKGEASVPRLTFRLAVQLTHAYHCLYERPDLAVVHRCAEEVQERWGGRAADALICAWSCLAAGMELPEELTP